MNGLNLDPMPMPLPLPGGPWLRRGHDEAPPCWADATGSVGVGAGTASAAPPASPGPVSDFAAMVSRCRAEQRESRKGEGVLPEPERPLVVTDGIRRVFGEVVRETRAQIAQGPCDERGWTATIVLASPGLGEIRVHLRRAGRRLSVCLQVGDEGVRGMLAVHLGDLVAALAVPGLDVEAGVSTSDDIPSHTRRTACRPSHPRPPVPA